MNVYSFVTQGSRKSGYGFQDSRSAVLSEPTIFNAFYGWWDQVSTWPSWEEMRYEGEERIATDRLHRRFPCTPRIVGNGTVAWQQRRFVDPLPLDNFDRKVLSQVDVFMRTHNIPELEFDDIEGAQAIGKDLMDLLGTLDSHISTFVLSSLRSQG